MGVDIAFYVLSALLLLTGALVAFRPRPMECALWLILHFFLTAALYVLLGAHFAAVIQILVYAGAIVVLFTFVILLLNLNPQELGGSGATPWSSFVLFVGSLASILLCFHVATPELLKPIPELAPESIFGSIESFSIQLLTNYMWSFEVAGVLLLLAVIAVGMLAYRKSRTEVGS
ncbi:MAG: NADH-quinone oxidoreductase subunit J [Bdellovibrionota bacterium]